MNGQTAGYITEFDVRSHNGSLHFVTVHTAGHEVPTYKPAESLDLWKRYLSGDWNLTFVEKPKKNEPDDYNFFTMQ